MRATKYDDSFPEKLLIHMSKGFSFESFGADVYAGKQTLYDWCKVHPDFNDARSIGRVLRYKYFEKLAMLKTSGQTVKGFNAKNCDTYLLSMILKTASPENFSEKINMDVNMSGGVKLTIDEFLIAKAEQRRIEREKKNVIEVQANKSKG